MDTQSNVVHHNIHTNGLTQCKKNSKLKIKKKIKIRNVKSYKKFIFTRKTRTQYFNKVKKNRKYKYKHIKITTTNTGTLRINNKVEVKSNKDKIDLYNSNELNNLKNTFYILMGVFGFKISKIDIVNLFLFIYHELRGVMVNFTLNLNFILNVLCCFVKLNLIEIFDNLVKV